MNRHTPVEDQVIGVRNRTETCDLEEVMRQCTNLTWNQVFLAVDRLSRSGEIKLVPTGLGMYALTFPHGKNGRLNRGSLRS